METQAHGALVDVLNVGILLVGPSGIGKSECALELVQRGHRLVADDVVRIERREPGGLVGRAPEAIRHYMEIRGVGIFHVPDLYGPEAVRREMRIDLLCRFRPVEAGDEFERLGLERPTETVAGVPVPALLLPARPAASLATLVELVARDHLQRRTQGPAADRIDAWLRARSTP